MSAPRALKLRPSGDWRMRERRGDRTPKSSGRTELEATSWGESPWTRGAGSAHPSSAESPGRGRAPGGQQCHCWGPRPREPSCPGGFHTAHSGLAGGAESDAQVEERGWVGQPGWAEGAWSGALRAGPGPGGAGNSEAALTRLHGPADDPQDVGGVPQLQAVVDTHVHLAGGG